MKCDLALVESAFMAHERLKAEFDEITLNLYAVKMNLKKLIYYQYSSTIDLYSKLTTV